MLEEVEGLRGEGEGCGRPFMEGGCARNLVIGSELSSLTEPTESTIRRL